ncbi:MAG: cytidylate kinase-like family protein, partial [Lachnospiraceae bacterium]|nr:cytidylate kinase-like family protein [Lachnospiraceae bacterium]
IQKEGQQKASGGSCCAGDVIRIFIYAPMEYKTELVMQVYGDSKDEARKNAKQRSASRSTYYRSVTGREWGDIHNYDLLINSSVGVDKSVEMIMSRIAGN